MGNLTLSSFGLLLIAITLGSFGQIFLKLGMAENGIISNGSMLQIITSLASAMVEPKVMIGLSIYVISTFFWLLVLSRVRLSVAYPLISMSYFLVVILSATILHEQINWRYAIAGLMFISAGVSFIGFGLGKAKKGDESCKG